MSTITPASASWRAWLAGLQGNCATRLALSGRTSRQSSTGAQATAPQAISNAKAIARNVMTGHYQGR
jgi:hypothetical protein